jgi:uncharacterized membrane protein
MVAPTHVTIATSTGVLKLALLLHFGAGLVGLVSGAVALATPKGGLVHRRSGIVFVIAMLTTGVMASAIAAYEGNVGSTVGGAFVVYLIFTALTAVRPIGAGVRGLNVALMTFAFLLALLQYIFGVMALSNPVRGVPAGMIFFLATITLLAAIGDWRMIRAGGLQGARRLARHLWRMCFGLFVATGSFFLGQIKFLPKPLRIMPLLLVLAVAPLLFLVYWLWRVRVRKTLRGIITAPPLDERKAA